MSGDTTVVHRLRCYRCGHLFTGRRSNIDTICPSCGSDSFTNADIRFGRDSEEQA